VEKGMEKGMDRKAVTGIMLILILIGALDLVFGVGLVGTESLSVDGNGAPTAPEYNFTLHAVVTDDPYWGPSGGYHAIWPVIQDGLAEIGIDFVIEQYDSYAWWEIVWNDGWNQSGGTPYPPGGWDLFISEWWMMPTGVIPLESLVYSWKTPPDGNNIMPWLSLDGDELLWRGMHYLDAVPRQTYLRLWQEEFMRDCPMINLYYPKIWETVAIWVDGWDPVVRFHDVSHLFINNTTKFEMYAPPERKLKGNDTLIYGVVEPLWNFNPLFTGTTIQKKLNRLTHDTLYALSRNPWPNGPFVMKPDLAANNLTWLTGPNGPNTRMRVPLRSNVTWNDGYPFNATDVKFTFDLILNPVTKAVAYGDFEHVIESVEIVNETCVDFILYEPYPDITTLLGIPGATIIPWHTLKDISPRALKAHPSNVLWTQYLSGTGPFNMTGFVLDDQITLKRNNLYFGYNASIVNPTNAPYGPYGEPYWGPYNITTLILQWIPDRDDRLLALQNLQIDFCQPIPAPRPTYFPCLGCPLPLNDTHGHVSCVPNDTSTHKEWHYNRPSSNLLFFNFNNPYLSNRYVRLAIAHAINYTKIFNEILPDWGVEGIPGKTPIIPDHYYTDPDGVTRLLFHDTLPPNAEDLVKAQKYMDLWYHSQVGTNWTMGPVGDADFDGYVGLSDFYEWRKNFGTTPAEWTFLPGCDIDPDFDNDGYVELYDFYRWRENFGERYP